MSGLQASTMLAYLAGAAVFVCVAMALYWGTHLVPSGYGMWTLSSALIGLAGVLIVGRGSFPDAMRTLIVPGLVVVAAVFRLEGLRRFFGHRRVGRLSPLLSMVVIVLLAVFTYASASPAGRSTVITGAIALIFWITSIHLYRGTVSAHSLSAKLVAGLFAVYGFLWLGAGVYWLAVGSGFPLERVGMLDAFFFAAITAFEFIWLVACLVFSTRWSAGELESARRRAESERGRLADIVAFLPDATFALDKERRIIAWNRVMAEKTGITASEVVGILWDETPVPRLLGGDPTLSEVLLDPSKTVPARCYNIRRDKDIISAEEEWSHADTPAKRSLFWHVASLFRDADGGVIGTIESIRDLTWKVEAERALRESEERYHSLFEHSLDGILLLAPGGAVVDANPSACQMLGMTKEQVCQAEPGSIGSWAGYPKDDARKRSVFDTAARESTLNRGDGSAFPAECVSVVWTDLDGHLRAFVQFRDISERVEAQRVMRESQARLLEAQVPSHMGSWEIDLVGQSIWLSPEALRIFGIEGHSAYFPLETGDLTDLIEDPAGFSEALSRVMSEGGSYDVEYSIKRPDTGALRKVRSVGAAVCGDGGMPMKVVGVTQDVTDSRASSGLPDLEFYSMAHSADQVFWVDSQGGISNVNDAACDQLGYSREELLQMTIYQVNPNLSPDSVEALDVVKRSQARLHETKHRTKEGVDIPVEVTVNYATFGGVEHKFVVAHDMSKRKRLEEILKLTQLSLQRGGDMIFWSDAKGRLAFVTDAMCSNLGYSRDELLAMSVFDIDPTAPREWARVWAEIMEGGAFTREASYRAKDGTEHLLDVVFTRAEHEGSDYALAVAHELSPERAGVSALASSDAEALQRERLEAVGQLAGGIAHDFNNLLTAIIGYGNLILADEDAKGLTSLRRDAEEIRNAAERAAALTSQILAFACRQPLRPRRVRLSSLVAGLEERLRNLLTDEIALTMSLSPEAGMVEVDTEQFELAIVNLAENAREAMPSGGSLSLEVQNVELSAEHCRAYAGQRAGSYVLLSVSDTGLGMDADTKMRMFDPFFTTKPPGDGAGLGLSVVHGIVRQSGGHVVVYSGVGKGTTVKLYLPRVADLGKTTPAPERDHLSSAATGEETIVVVEDEPPLRRLVARVLGEAGYRVFVAGSGPEALEMLEDMPSPPDLLLTDVILPGGMQGNELADKATATIPGLRVLYVSGHPRDAIVHAGRLDDGVCFLGKPFTPQILVEKVRDVLGWSQP